jgi:hypothetical protein
MTKAERRCTACGQILSRYNDTDLCGVCTTARRRAAAVGLIPPRIWFLPVMRAALAQWDWATVLSVVVAETGANQTQLAEMIGISQPHVSRLMKRQAQCFDIRTVRCIVDGLGAPRVLAGLSPTTAGEAATVPTEPPREPEEEVVATDRRTMLAASFAVPMAAVLGSPCVSESITYDRAQQIRRLLPDLYALDDQAGGPAVSDVAQWCLREVDRLLNTADYSEPVGRQLRVTYGELAEMAGWLEFDAGRFERSQYFYGEALRSAQLADDLNLEVLVLASMIMLARHRGRPREAVQLAHLAQRRAHGWATPRLSALLSTREAIGWAQMGDMRGAHSAMNRAYNLFEWPARDDDPHWISFFDHSELTAMRAMVSSYLGSHEHTISHLRDALDGLGTRYTRNRALYLSRLALAQLGVGDERGACTTLDSGLTIFVKVDSGRASAQLGECFRSIATSRAPYARALMDRAQDLDLIGSTA